MRFLLPGLCHLTAEDEARHVCLEAHLHHVLIDYVTSACEQLILSNNDDVTTTAQSVATACSVFLNIIVAERSLVAQDSKFDDLLKFLAAALPKFGQLLCTLVSVCIAIRYHAATDQAFSKSRFWSKTRKW